MLTLSDQLLTEKICPNHKLDTFINFGNIYIDTPKKGKSQTNTEKGQHLQLVKIDAALLKKAELH